MGVAAWLIDKILLPDRGAAPLSSFPADTPAPAATPAPQDVRPARR
jgi:hypothetical protein